MVTAMTGTLKLMANPNAQVPPGMNRQKAYSFQSSDVLAGPLILDPNVLAVAGGPITSILAPFDGYIDDMSSPATNTVTTIFQVLVNYNVKGVIAVAETLNTLPQRPINHVSFSQGDVLQFIQR